MFLVRLASVHTSQKIYKDWAALGTFGCNLAVKNGRTREVWRCSQKRLQVEFLKVPSRSSHGRLQLHFRYGGKRHYLSLGLPDTKESRKLAEMRAREIELDVFSGHFDHTLQKYQPQRALSSVDAPDITAKITASPSLAELWGKFVEYKRPQCSPNTMLYVYGHFTKYVEKLPTHDLNRAAEIRDYAVRTFPLDSCKRFITRLNACCNWAVKSGMIPENPFIGMAGEVKLPKSQKKSEDDDIDPFTAEERDSILAAIAANSFCNKHSGFKHSYYRPYVEFSFMTGCRPSEAIALQWKHISGDFTSINFEQAIIETGKGRQVREGLKTQERRRFPCNAKLQTLLKAIKPETCDPESLVFPGYNGGYLDTRSFRKNVWKPILTGLKIEYRRPYQTRHTFVTLALENNLDAKDVARLVGNSPEVIYRHYAGNKRELFVPEFNLEVEFSTSRLNQVGRNIESWIWPLKYPLQATVISYTVEFYYRLLAYPISKSGVF